MALSENCFIDLTYFNIMTGLTISVGSNDELKFNNLCNSVVSLMEGYCGRPLKSRRFSYVSSDYNYDPENTIILNPPSGDTFYFPTYPVSNIEEFNIDDVEITPATDFSGSDGYILFNKQGKMVYYNGFGTYITCIYTGGYDYLLHPDQFDDLQYITYLLISELWFASPGSTQLASEKIGNYSYTNFDIKQVSKTLGLSPSVFYKLGKYKRYFIE